MKTWNSGARSLDACSSSQRLNSPVRWVPSISEGMSPRMFFLPLSLYGMSEIGLGRAHL